MAQELLTTIGVEPGEVALVPGTGGVYVVRLDGETVWSRKEAGRFPEAKELQKRIRDRIAPNMVWAIRTVETGSGFARNTRRHCEVRSAAAIQNAAETGLLRSARNDEPSV